MMPKRETPPAIEERARFFGQVLSWMLLVVALCAFVPLLAGLLYGVNWETGLALGVFALATYALIAMTPTPETLPATIRDVGSPTWSVFSYCIITGLGWNWACVFLWFSRRYAFFSIPVITVTGLIMASYGAIAFLVAFLTGGTWRTVLAVFLFATGVPAAVVLRLDLLR
jgi:hypothetical protein